MDVLLVGGCFAMPEKSVIDLAVAVQVQDEPTDIRAGGCPGSGLGSAARQIERNTVLGVSQGNSIAVEADQDRRAALPAASRDGLAANSFVIPVTFSIDANATVGAPDIIVIASSEIA